MVQFGGETAVRKIKAIVIIVFTMTCGSIGRGEANDISANYGFGEMDIVKLNWGISNLKTADFDGDGLTDIAVVNDAKARIEILLQKKNVSPTEVPPTVDPNDIDINAINAPSRYERQSVPLSQKIYSMACGDFERRRNGRYRVLRRTQRPLRYAAKPIRGKG